MDTHEALAREFVRSIDFSEDWAVAGHRVLPILRRARGAGDAELAKMVEAVVATGRAEPTLAALAYLGDIICEDGLPKSKSSFRILMQYILPAATENQRLGATLGIASIMSRSAAKHLRTAAASEPLAYIREMQERTAEVIERSVAANQEDKNSASLAG